MVTHELKVDPREFLMRVLLFFLCVCSVSYAQTQAAKVTKIKLEDYGWQPVPDRRQFGHTYSHNLWIDHKGRVLVGFTVREDHALATREHRGRTFHILRFTAEGKAELSVALPTNDWYKNEFYLGPDDQIFARANDTLQLFSEDASQGQSGSWQPMAPCPENCFISQSSSRRTLILRVQPPVGEPDRPTYTILDASSSPPRVARTCSQMAFYAERITDKFAYWGNYYRDDDLMVRFPFCDVEHYEDFPQWGRGGGYILNDETLLKVGPYEAKLLGPDGQVKFSLNMPKHDYLDSNHMATDRGNDRFAFMVATVRGEHPRLDINGYVGARRVLVLDETGKQLASIPTDTHYHMDTNFSMSPDGHRLAILDDGVLTIAELQ